MALAQCALLRFCATPHGETFAASLRSELVDSALLGYLRRRSRCEREASSSKSHRPAKSKKTVAHLGNCLFGGVGEI